MKNKFNFKNLFVLDLANNHQGSYLHGKDVIREVADVVKNLNVKAGIKFQFRQLKTFIHPDHYQSSKQKHLVRFKSTELKIDEYSQLLNEVKINNLISICTPFDEESVEIIKKMRFDIIKIASCSAKDWPLLERVAESNLPIICSTGGLSIEEIDDLVSFFEHRYCDFSIMHCVSLYPTPDENMNLNQIDILKKRYHDKIIGWSTHEDPNDLIPISIAVGKGAQMFERHIGLSTKDIKLNGYSSDPKQLNDWISSAKKAMKICGENSKEITKDEIASLDSLKRGIYLRRDLPKGTIIKRDDVFFAMPYESNQLDSGCWSDDIRTNIILKKNQPIFAKDVVLKKNNDEIILKKAIHKVKAMLTEAKIFLNSDFEVEYSHHYGIKNFNRYGVVIINVINREYCKKILVQLPNQEHPAHYHKLKEETFQILSGRLNTWIDGKKKVLNPGDVSLVLPGVWHSFSTDQGCIFEEVSTTHYNNDSVYKDVKINKLKRTDRKTIVNHWGRWELSEKLSSISKKTV